MGSSAIELSILPLKSLKNSLLRLKWPCETTLKSPACHVPKVTKVWPKSALEFI